MSQANYDFDQMIQGMDRYGDKRIKEHSKSGLMLLLLNEMSFSDIFRSQVRYLLDGGDPEQMEYKFLHAPAPLAPPAPQAGRDRTETVLDLLITSQVESLRGDQRVAMDLALRARRILDRIE